MTSTTSSPSSRRRRSRVATVTSSLFPFACSCADTSSLSISPRTSLSSSSPSSSSAPLHRRRRIPDPSSATSSSSSRSALLPAGIPHSDFDLEDNTSFSDLLDELRELEHHVMTWGKGRDRHKHRRPRRAERWKESVAVEKETQDPMGELRRSMMAMVAERATVCGGDMAELLVRFLAINDPENHHLVVAAFERVWGEVFGGEKPPPLWLLLHGVVAVAPAAATPCY